MNGGFTITGVDEVISKLENKFSSRKLDQIERQALKMGATYAKYQLNYAVESYRDTGATVREVTAGKPRKKAGHLSVKVGWEGGKSRWRLVHLNEWGYTRNGRTYSPRGLGVVQKAFSGMKDEIKNTQVEYLKRMVDL